MIFRLCIFTNTIPSSPKVSLLQETYSSFVKTFGNSPVTVYCDENPEPHKFNEYRRNIEDMFGFDVIKTKSLSDGYIKAINENFEKYLFILEHDWKFKNIEHSLIEILNVMQARQMYHLRFNKYPNQLGYKDAKATRMEPKEYNGLEYVETDSLSNNPHIIWRQYYQKHLLDKIIKRKGSKGIEENLTNKGLIGNFYGGLKYPATIRHINGKKYGI